MQKRDILKRGFRGLSVVLFAIGLVGSSLAQNGKAETIWAPAAQEGQIQVVRAYYSGRAMLDSLAAWLEPWEVHAAEGYLVAGVTPEQARQMQALGFRLEPDRDRTQTLEAALAGFRAGDYDCYRSVEETYAAAASLPAAYPGLARWVDIGDSWDKLTPGGPAGYDLRVIILGSPSAQPKPALFIMASMHPRELAPAELALRFAEQLAAGYGQNADITWLLDTQDVHLLLQANPDGRKYAEAGILWRKNTNQNYCSIQLFSRGADLNRNFSYQWGCCSGSSSDTCSETYRGPTPASEPETQAVEAYLRSLYPDLRLPGEAAPAPASTSGLFLDLHSYGELVLWPWAYTTSNAPNAAALQTLGRKLAYLNGYYPAPAWDLYITDGDTTDFAYGKLGLPAYTFEVGTYFFEQCSTFENQVLPDNLPALLYAFKTVHRPYQYPAGPEALSVQVVMDASRDLAQITARLDDTRFSSFNGSEPVQPLAAGEVSIDMPPWSTHPPPLRLPMLPADGAFDSPQENVTLSLDTSGLEPGRHIVYVRGQDAAGNWGVASAAFLYRLTHTYYFPLVSSRPGH